MTDLKARKSNLFLSEKSINASHEWSRPSLHWQNRSQSYQHNFKCSVPLRMMFISFVKKLLSFVNKSNIRMNDDPSQHRRMLAQHHPCRVHRNNHHVTFLRIIHIMLLPRTTLIHSAVHHPSCHRRRRRRRLCSAEVQSLIHGKHEKLNGKLASRHRLSTAKRSLSFSFSFSFRCKDSSAPRQCFVIFSVC